MDTRLAYFTIEKAIRDFWITQNSCSHTDPYPGCICEGEYQELSALSVVAAKLGIETADGSNPMLETIADFDGNLLLLVTFGSKRQEIVYQIEDKQLFLATVTDSKGNRDIASILTETIENLADSYDLQDIEDFPEWPNVLSALSNWLRQNKI